MTDTPDMFECRLVGYSKQSRKDGDWVEIRLHIHPDDVTPALAQAPLKTVFMVAAVPVEPEKGLTIENCRFVSDGEGVMATKPKRSWGETPLSEQVAIRSAKPHFQEWLAAYWGDPEIMDRASCDVALKRFLRISSKTEIKPGTFAGSDWLNLDQEYQDSCGLIAQRTT